MASTLSKDDALKAAIWLVPIIFTAGGLMWQGHHVQQEVHALESSVDEHVVLGAHPVASVQLEEHRTVLETFIVEQKEMRTEQHDQAVNISAICQATGARCK